MWGGGRTEANLGGQTQSLVRESNKKCVSLGASEHAWFLGCGDARDVIDGEECIISIMKSLLPGVGVHVDDRKGNSSRNGRCASLEAT